MKIIKIIIIFSLVISSLNAKNKPITLQLKWKHQFQFAGYYAAFHKGYYKEEGIEVIIKEASYDTNMIEEVLSNKAQFGIGTSELILDFAKNKPIVVLGVIFQHSPLAIMSLNKDIKTIHDLVGKTIMIEDGSADIYALLKRENIDINSLKILPHTFNTYSLIENKIDAMSVYSIDEPYYLRQKGLRYNIFSPREAGIDFYGDNLFTSKDMLNLNPDIVEKFRRASFKGWQYAMSNQDEIIEIIMKNYNTQNKTKKYYEFEAEKMMELIYPDILEIGYMNKGRWEHIANVYQELGFLNKDINLENFLYFPNKTFFEKYRFILFIILISIIVGFFTYYIRKMYLKVKISEQKYKLIFQNSPLVIITWKKDYVITNWNNQATKLFGWTVNDVLGKSFMDFLIPENEKTNISKYMNNFYQNNDLNIFMNQNIMKNGSLVNCEWYNTFLPNFEVEDDFEVVSLVVDITQKIENEKFLMQQANFDPLTSLPNRYYFETILEKFYSLSNRNNTVFGLALIELDGFKVINDNYGDIAQTFVLQNIAQRFQENIRKEDIVAKISENEFALAFHILDINENYETFFKKLLDLASTPVQYTEEIVFQVTASIGASFYSAQNKVTIKDLIKQANSAKYKAKKIIKKNSFCICEPTPP